MALEISLFKGIVNQISGALFSEYEFNESVDLDALCRKVIQKEFMTAVDAVRPLLEMRMSHVEHPFWVDVNDDLGDRVPEAVASFDVYRTRQYGQYAFWISAHLLYDSVRCELGFETAPKLVSQMETWVHELVHMADYEVIQQFRTKFEEGKGVGFDERPGSLRMIHRSEGDPDGFTPRQWQFLQIMNHCRCEGVAQLQTILTGLEEAALKEGEKARAIFRDIFEAAYQGFIRPKGSVLSSEGRQKWGSLLKTLRQSAYSIGPWMVLDCLGGNLETLEEKQLLAVAEQAMSTKGEPLSPENACRLTGRVLEMDCGMFLKGLCSPLSTHKWGEFITMEELSEIAHYLTIDDAELGEYPNFLSHLIEAGVEKDADRFIASLKEVLGYPMEGAEIEAQMVRFADTGDDPGDLREMVQAMGVRIYKAWQNDPEEILRWLLTYLLDPEDLFFDRVPYLGLMDDYYVLHTGFKLSRAGKQAPDLQP